MMRSDLFFVTKLIFVFVELNELFLNCFLGSPFPVPYLC